MTVFGSIRAHVVTRMPLYVFVVVYFITTVFANIMYTTAIGRSWPSMSIADFHWDTLSVGFEFWLLLLLPFAFVPVVSLLARPILEIPAAAVARFATELTKGLYFAIAAVSYLYVFRAIYDAGAADLLVSGTDAVSAVEARFQVLARLGFWPQVVMQSLLVFLAVYAGVTASREGGRFWYLAVLWHVTVLSACLVLLNMRWPVVLFIVTLSLCVLVMARRFAVIKAGAVLALGVAVYLLISVVVLRLVPASSEEIASRPQPAAGTPVASTQAASAGPSSTAGTLPPGTPRTETTVPAVVAADADYLKNAVGQGRDQALNLLIGAVNRMAVSAPYYYSVFSEEGQVCGTLVDRVLRKPSACQPSQLIYTRMFGADGFEGRATAPAAVHISAYALGGWLGVAFVLAVTAITLGGFLALWPFVQRSNLIAAVFIMGGYASYFWTQLPFEAALVYSHGVIWWAAVAIGSSAAVRTYRALVEMEVHAPAR
jgi:hypothetical protein